MGVGPHFGGTSVCRDDLHQSLEIVLSVVTGATAALPPWKGNQVEGRYVFPRGGVGGGDS